MKRAAVVIALCYALFVGLVLAIVASGSSYAYKAPSEQPLQVHDKYLLTPEQQRILVRDGEVSVVIHGVEYTFHNDESMRPYLNEGGIR